MEKILFRKSTLDDYSFCLNVHHEVLKGHISNIWGWNQAQQDQMYKNDFDHSFISIISSNGLDVGYLEINKTDTSIHICNLLILPLYQGKGIGTNILKDIIKSRDNGTVVELGVFKVNERAKNLYDRIGFEVVGETETHFMMELK